MSGPIARRLAKLAEQGQAVARDQRTPTMRPGPGSHPKPTREDREHGKH